MDLNTIWFWLIGVLIIGYAILDGFDFGCCGMIQLAISQAGGHSASRENSRPDEVAAIEINRRIGDLAGGNFVRLFQQTNNGSIVTVWSIVKSN